MLRRSPIRRALTLRTLARQVRVGGVGSSPVVAIVVSTVDLVSEYTFLDASTTNASGYIAREKRSGIIATATPARTS